MADLAADLVASLEAEPAGNLDDGRVIAAGVDPELDQYRSLASDAKRHILELEERERKRTGISSLKVRYNRVFGYSIEITRANQAAVPADYVRRQTLANAERYVTPEVQELEERILHAEDRRLTIERRLYAELVARIAADTPRLQRLGQAIAGVDALAAFAEVAARRGYVRPQLLAAGSGVAIEEGRHPVLEGTLGESFVPNDLELDPQSSQIVLLTGPNMGGKSTYLRQAALLVLMAQAGSFVPARRAAIGVVDRIFSRVGASDDLARGESTFMVEMIETANILRFATPESLVILDEVGRGTATFDGLSLAWAIVEHLHERVRPLTLFATHYHELTELADLLPRVVNRTMAVKEWEDRIVFLRRVAPGSADKSYGIHVAKLAGLPESVVTRAQQVLANLEAKEFDPEGRPRIARGELPADRKTAQLPLFTPAEEVVAGVLRDLDLERLTPLAALNLLASLKDRLNTDDRRQGPLSRCRGQVDHARRGADPLARAAGGDRAGDAQHRVGRPTARAGRRSARCGPRGHFLPRRRRRTGRSSARRRRAGAGGRRPRPLLPGNRKATPAGCSALHSGISTSISTSPRWSTSTTASPATPSTAVPTARPRAGSRQGQWQPWKACTKRASAPASNTSPASAGRPRIPICGAPTSGRRKPSSIGT